jgi:hypothetical protein
MHHVAQKSINTNLLLKLSFVKKNVVSSTEGKENFGNKESMQIVPLGAKVYCAVIAGGVSAYSLTSL